MLGMEMESDNLIAAGWRVAPAPQSSPTVEDCYRNLVAAVLLQAQRDLAEPNYRGGALRWLRSPAAKQYAEMLGIEPSAVSNLLRGRRQ